MLVEAGCRGVIIAHSERRQFFGETDETANRKVKAALAAGLTPILCVGETLAEREAEIRTNTVLDRQFRRLLAALTTTEFSRIIVAYEPVWAIGTGRTATPGDGGRGAPVPARSGGGVCSAPEQPRRFESSTAEASNPTTSRG